MLDYQKQFIELAVRSSALCFGEFTLKSGRNSPYFFNAGKFSTGLALSILGSCYAQRIVDSGVPFDMLFGPAYKGIPLVAVTAAVLAKEHGIDKPYAFNRKEAKAHGEGGSIVGAPLAGSVLILDDVITAGTAIREVMELLADNGATPAGVVIGLDRCEKGPNNLSAIQTFQQEYSVDVSSIITIEHLLEYLSNLSDGSDNPQAYLSKMKQYWEKYGA